MKQTTINIDSKGKVLGRLASKIASMLLGKDKPSFNYNKISGDKVIAYNTKDIIVTGNKAKNKKYYRHSGYLGHLKEKSFFELFKKNPNRVVYLAVRGMLPKNKLQKLWLKNLTLIKENINEK